MAQERLGLFDTPPDRSEVRIGVAIIGLIYVALLGVLPEYDFQVGQIPGFIPATSAILLICDLITAAILYAQATVFRSRALTILASGYVLSGLLFVPYALTFPGAFSPKGLLGAGLNTTGWIAVCWRITTPVAILFYASLKRVDATAAPIVERPPARILLGAAAAVALAVLVTMVTTLGHDMLPPFFVDESVVIRSVLVGVNVTVLALTIAAMVVLFRQEKSVLDLWLLVAMSCWIAQSVLNAFLRSRFSLGAYVFFALAFLSNLIVMLALITESNRLYARLAASTAARDREREARLMSMDAVAAAIAHEVGQPLTAARLSTSAALKLLTASKPNATRAIKSLRETLDSEDRTFDVIRSLRMTFGNGAGTVSEFNLNDLARETVSLMDRELAAQKIAIQFSLEDNLPQVLGNRVQIQRVIINLLTNAIESIVAARGQRRIVVRSTSTDSLNVQLDVSDSGGGISPDKMTQIFEPFFTSKAKGTGLGLSLSRTIVEEHGGRLWASAAENSGATFHLQLIRRPAGQVEVQP